VYPAEGLVGALRSLLDRAVNVGEPGHELVGWVLVIEAKAIDPNMAATFKANEMTEGRFVDSIDLFRSLRRGDPA
jgi:hypothetical protein